jgi:aminoglycoside 3-N-acetyltransferase
MITAQELEHGFETLSLRGQPVIAHASFKSLGPVQGGPQTVVDALLATTGGLMMPAFTYETLVYPRSGPDQNGLDYPSEHAWHNLVNEDGAPVYFRADMPVDREIGVTAETLRRHPNAKRSLHPVLSFCGVNVDFALNRQSMENPLGPIGKLARRGGWVVLIGVGHEVNTSIHYAEKKAGRPRFTRWAATPRRVVECPNFPGDSFGFTGIEPHVHEEARSVVIGNAHVQALPLPYLIETAQRFIKENPLALLCQREFCGRCHTIRAMVGGTDARDLPEPLNLG